MTDNLTRAQDFLSLHNLPEGAVEALAELLDQAEERAYLKSADEAESGIFIDPRCPHGCSCRNCHLNSVRQGIGIRLRGQVLREAEIFTPEEIRILRGVLKYHVPLEDTSGALLSSVPSALFDSHPYIADQRVVALTQKLGEWTEEDQKFLEGNIEFSLKMRRAEAEKRA